jgi:ribosomal-protein-serine acetyltransferase
VLRPNAAEFAPQLHAAAMESLATVGRWMPWCHPGRTEREGLEWYRICEENWRGGVEYEFSAFDPSGEYLGAGGLNQFNRVHNFANLGYWVRQSRQGQGIAVEVARLIADFGFRTLGLARIEIVVAEENRPSRRVAEKLGATFEGIARRRILLRGASIDAAMYSLVPGACA